VAKIEEWVFIFICVLLVFPCAADIYKANYIAPYFATFIRANLNNDSRVDFTEFEEDFHDVNISHS